jgi:hypothetical protein
MTDPHDTHELDREAQLVRRDLKLDEILGRLGQAHLVGAQPAV